MRAAPDAQPTDSDEVFTIAEVARAAGVTARQVRTWAAASNVALYRGFLRQADAVELVSQLRATGRSERGRQTSLGLGS
jgi:hypothetical protein